MGTHVFADGPVESDGLRLEVAVDDDGRAVVVANGEADCSNAPRFAAVLDRVMTAGATEVVVDADGLLHPDLATVHVLLYAAHRGAHSGVVVRVINSHGTFHRVLNRFDASLVGEPGRA
jgi:anti-anti-sigma factor